MRFILSFGFMFIIKIAISQSGYTTDSASSYISKLNWQSFGISWNYVTKFYLRSDAKELIKMKDPSKFEKLLKNIEDSTKTVTIHSILTQSLEREKGSFKIEYLHLNDTSSAVIGTKFTYNTLQWFGNEVDGYKIEKSEISKIQKYWSRIINSNNFPQPATPSHP